MKQFILGALAVTILYGLLACQPGGNAAASSGGVLFKVNGRPITGEEFVRSPYIRQSLREFIFYESMQDQVRKAGIEVDEAEFNRNLEEYKRNVQQSGMTWETYLQETGVTEEEALNQMRENLLMQELADSRTKVSEEEIQRVWETDRESLVDEYINENHLPDSDKPNVTFEQVRDLAIERVKMHKGMIEQGEMVADIILGAELELVSVADPVDREQLQNLILYNSKEGALQQKEDLAAQREEYAKAMGLDIEDVPKPEDAAEGDSAAEGEAAKPDAEAGAEAEQQPATDGSADAPESAEPSAAPVSDADKGAAEGS